MEPKRLPIISSSEVRTSDGTFTAHLLECGTKEIDGTKYKFLGVQFQFPDGTQRTATNLVDELAFDLVESFIRGLMLDGLDATEADAPDEKPEEGE